MPGASNLQKEELSTLVRESPDLIPPKPWAGVQQPGDVHGAVASLLPAGNSARAEESRWGSATLPLRSACQVLRCHAACRVAGSRSPWRKH